MRKAVFVVATLCKDPTAQFPLRDTDIELLDAIELEAGLDADVVFVNEELKFAGKEKKLLAPQLKGAHEKVIKEIADSKPEFVFAFGVKAMACLLNRGSATLKNHRRKSNIVKGIDCPVFVTDSLSRIVVQPGIRKWLRLDVLAAVRGFNKTKYGEHTLLTPDMEAWDVCPEEFKSVRRIGFDLETYPGTDPWADGARIRMAILSSRKRTATVVQTDNGELPGWVTRILADPKVEKGGSNIAFDYRWCARFGYEVNNLHDTETAEHIIDCTDPNKNLKFLALRYAPELNDYNRPLDERIKKIGGWEFLKDEEMYEYAGGDGEASIAAMLEQQEIIAASPHRSKIWKLSKDVYNVQCHMNTVGMCVDKPLNDELYAGMEVKLIELVAQIQEHLGPINPASHTQLAKSLKEDIKGINLSVRHWVKVLSDDEDEDISTDRAVLQREAHKHPVIGVVLEHRRWNKLFGSYVKAFREKHMVKQLTGYFVYPSYLSARAETLRWASKNPNAQQLPRKPGEDEDILLNVKRQFISRYEGGVLLQGDMAQAEVRVAAQESGDRALLDAVAHEDVHRTTAALMFRRPAEDITGEMRQAAKTIGFATLYGAGAGRISKLLDVGFREAQDLMGQYFRAYPQLRQFINDTYIYVMKNLSVTTPFGHTRTFVRPPFGNWHGFEGARVKRQGFNTIIQSTAACIMFVILIDVMKAMQDARLRSKLIGSVHDSLMIDVYPGELETVRSIVADKMVNPNTEVYGYKLIVPLGVDIEVGLNWGEMKDLTLREG